MNFEYLMDLSARNQFDEVRLIGRTIESQGRSYHFLAMTRVGEELYLYIMAQTEPWEERALPDDATMRQSMKSQFYMIGGAVNISKIEINDLLIESNGGQSYTMDMNLPESLMLLSRLSAAGWSIPKDSVFYEMEWNCIEMMQWRIRTPLQTLPEWENARICVTWGSIPKQYYVEKRIKLTVSDRYAQTAEDAKAVVFTIRDRDGRPQEAVCYMNRISLIDLYAEHEKQFADPEYQRLAKERISEEEFESIKKSTYQALEQECPRGMRLFGIEYECTMDLSLQFYSSEYLDSKQREHIHQGSASLYLSNPKADKEQGVHGLKMRACMVHTPVDPDTKEMCAELFTAYELIPEREEEFFL